jgi:glycosyltransferase involved in cell wall biosynthesis
MTGIDQRVTEQGVVGPAPDSTPADDPNKLPGVLFCTLGREADPSAVLTSLYQSHAAGWRLKIVEPSAPVRRRFSFGSGIRRRRGTFTADSLSTLLFKTGFVETRVETKGGMITASSTRGELPPPTHRPLRLSVVLPVYNERETFSKVFDELVNKEIVDAEIEIVLIESNSTDGTREEVLSLPDDPRVNLILEDKPSGKGHAVRAGLARATGDVVLIQDADAEYDMGDYEKLLEPLRTFEASFVLGAREIHEGRRGMRHFEREQHMSQLMNIGHVAFLGLFNTVYGQRLKDPFTMYKVFRRDCLTDIHLECDRFDFDWELTAKLIRRGHHPVEVPVSYHSRSFSEGKKIKLLADPISWVRACFKYRFTPLYRSDNSDVVCSEDDYSEVGGG